VVARALRLRIKLADGVVLRRVLGSGQLSGTEVAEARHEEQAVDAKLYRDLGIAPDRQRDDEDGIKMLIPYFFASDSHVIMLQLQVPPGTDRRKLADVFLKYKDLVHGRNGMDEREVVIGYTQSEEQLTASISRPVKKNLLGFMAGEALLSAAGMVQNGAYLQAAELLAAQSRLLTDASGAWKDPDLQKDAELLGTYTSVIASLQNPGTTGTEDLRAYLAKTMSSAGYKLVQ
jgi:hypothetical protein